MVRIIEHINSFEEIYQPVSIAEINYVERELNFSFPDSLKKIYQSPNLYELDRVGTFLWFIKHLNIGILDVNLSLREESYFNKFPTFLIAFYTNECGDYWCINTKENNVVYIGNDETIDESLENNPLKLDSVEDFIFQKFFMIG